MFHTKYLIKTGDEDNVDAEDNTGIIKVTVM